MKYIKLIFLPNIIPPVNFNFKLKRIYYKTIFEDVFEEINDN